MWSADFVALRCFALTWLLDFKQWRSDFKSIAKAHWPPFMPGRSSALSLAGGGVSEGRKRRIYGRGSTRSHAVNADGEMCLAVKVVRTAFGIYPPAVVEPCRSATAVS
jgi:hypothetical protein